MNKKGFTLVEVLVVLVILGSIMALVSTSILGITNKTKKQVIEQEKRNIKEAAGMLALDLDNYRRKDVYNCNDTDESWLKGNSSTEGHYCEKDPDTKKWKRVIVTVDELIAHNYMEDSEKHCKGTVEIINKQGDYVITVNDITCEK